ncbi:hypothetical protein M3Y99_01290900 [Aphelenchoides fujianensis]|nr:hypothetical protein M3Y99_01290900 [Aphelenchoides fujianensis]
MGCSWSRRAAADSFGSKQEAYQTPQNGGQRQKERRNTGFVGLESPLSAGRRTANGHSALNRRDTPTKAASENGPPKTVVPLAAKPIGQTGSSSQTEVLSNARGEDRPGPGRLQRLRNGKISGELRVLATRDLL